MRGVEKSAITPSSWDTPKLMVLRGPKATAGSESWPHGQGLALISMLMRFCGGWKSLLDTSSSGETMSLIPKTCKAPSASCPSQHLNKDLSSSRPCPSLHFQPGRVSDGGARPWGPAMGLSVPAQPGLVPSRSLSSAHLPSQRHTGRFWEEKAVCQVHPSLAHGVRETTCGQMGCVLSQVGPQLPQNLWEMLFRIQLLSLLS